MAEAKAHITSVKNIEDGGLKIRGYANTTTKDRAGDVIPREAWDAKAMENYMKNPIILAFHDHSRPVGRMTGYTVTDKGLEIEATLSSADTQIHQLVSEGVLSTFSVGFAIKDAEYIREEDTFLIKQVELHEVSVVSVPCNQDSTFQVSKSMNGSEYSGFIKEFKPNDEATNDLEARIKRLEELVLNDNTPEGDPLLEALALAFPQFNDTNEPSGQ